MDDSHPLPGFVLSPWLMNHVAQPLRLSRGRGIFYNTTQLHLWNITLSVRLYLMKTVMIGGNCSIQAVGKYRSTLNKVGLRIP